MRLKHLITEISAAEKRRQRAAQADAQRLAAQQALQAQQAALAAKVQQRTQRKLDRFNQPVSQTPQSSDNTTKTKSTAAQGGIADLLKQQMSGSEWEKYQVDPTVDTSFQGGKYLQFEKAGENIVAYWSNNPEYSFSQVQQLGQFQNLGLVFDQQKFESLLKQLVNKFKYVHILIKEKYVDDWELMNPKSFFRGLLYFLAQNYPHDQPTQDPNVNWEIDKT